MPRSTNRQYVPKPALGHSIGLKASNTTDLVRMVQQGLPYRMVERFRKSSGMTIDEISEFVQIPKRTLSRRKEEGRLRADESERLVRISGIYEKAFDLFDGNAPKAT